MTSPCPISAYLCFSGSFFMCFQYKMRHLVASKKKNQLFAWGWDRKIPSLPITVCHHSARLVMPIGDPLDGFFYPTLKLNIYSDIHKYKTNRQSLYRILWNFMREQTLFPVVVHFLHVWFLSRQNCFENCIYGGLPFWKPTMKLEHVLVQLRENRYRVV